MRQEKVLGNVQKRLQEMTIAIVGVGALGSVSAKLLDKASIKKLILIDRDVVEESNLHRQDYLKENLGSAKVHSLNLDCEVERKFVDLTHKNIDKVIDKNVDLILDGTDNVQTRLLINDYCRKNNIPWIYGSAIRQEGYVFLVDKDCFRNVLKPASLETCESSGVTNTITNLIATLQVQVIYDCLSGVKRNMLHVDLETGIFERIKIPEVKQDDFKYLKEGVEQIRLCGGTYQFNLNVDYEKLKKIGKNIGYCIKFDEILVMKDGRVIVKAESEEKARKIVSEKIGM